MSTRACESDQDEDVIEVGDDFLRIEDQRYPIPLGAHVEIVGWSFNSNRIDKRGVINVWSADGRPFLTLW